MLRPKPVPMPALCDSPGCERKPEVQNVDYAREGSAYVVAGCVSLCFEHATYVQLAQDRVRREEK